MDQAHRVSRQGPQASLVVVREKFGFVRRHVDLDRTLALAAFAGETQIERVLHVLVAPAARHRIAFEHLEQQPRPAASRVLLVVCHPIARTHRSAVLPPALPNPHTTRRRERKAAAVVGESEMCRRR